MLPTPDHVRRLSGVVEDFEASLSGSGSSGRVSLSSRAGRLVASLLQVLFMRQRLGMP